MSDIFMSWGSPDAPIARPLIERLRDAGLSVWEYETSGRAGEHVSNSVRREIESALTVVVLVSPQTKDRPWIVSELTTAFNALSRGEILSVVCVRLGGLADEELPDPLRRENVRSFSLDEAQDEQDILAQLVSDIQVGLGNRAPLVVPTALLAMTREEFRMVFPPDGSRNELLERICSKVGMRGHPMLALRHETWVGVLLTAM
jgi:hypothetical protein